MVARKDNHFFIKLYSKSYFPHHKGGADAEIALLDYFTTTSCT